MDRDAHDELIAAFGPWFAFNLRLGDDEWALGPDLVGMAEQRVASVSQAVADHLGSLAGASVIDLGCHHGGFGLELAAKGAQVTFVEGRAELLEHAKFASHALGLDDRTRFVQSDVRNLDHLDEYDVVLCLGLLYHLRGDDLEPFVTQLRRICRRLMVCETQVAKRAPERIGSGARVYHGRRYAEDVRSPGASLDGAESTWLTKPSLVNLLGDCGFTTVTELLAPRSAASYLLDDHVTLVALAGQRQSVDVVPPASANRVRMPETPPRFTHPVQGRRYRLRSRLAGSGRNFWASMWDKHPTRAEEP